MHLTDLLVADRVAIWRAASATTAGKPTTVGLDKANLDKVGLDKAGLDKPAAIRALAALLASAELPAEEGGGAIRLDQDEVERVLLDREKLQSTGIGEGVAIPHGAMTQLTAQVAALLIVPAGVEFAAIDERSVTILFAVIGPKRATGEHLKTLARVSRLLRNQSFRDQLIASKDARTAYDLIAAEEGDPR